MEDTTQPEKQETEYKDPNEDQGGIRRRLRDRDLLRKRKAEAEEKETNQWVFGVESPRKRTRVDNRSGAKRRGRPRKSQPSPEVAVSQEEAAAAPQEAPVALPEPAEVIPDQTPGSVEPQPASVLADPAPLPVFGSIQNPVFAPTLASPAPVYPTPTLITPSISSFSPDKVIDTAPVLVQDLAPSTDLGADIVSVPDPVPNPVPDPVPDLAPAETSVQAEAPAPPPLPTLEETFIGTQGRENLDQVLIEDLGPDEEEDVPLSEDKREDADLDVTPSFSQPEQNKMYSVPTLSSQPAPQEYLPGNSV